MEWIDLPTKTGFYWFVREFDDREPIMFLSFVTIKNKESLIIHQIPSDFKYFCKIKNNQLHIKDFEKNKYKSFQNKIYFQGPIDLSPPAFKDEDYQVITYNDLQSLTNHTYASTNFLIKQKSWILERL